MKTIIHINQHNIKYNRKPENVDKKLVITVKTYKATTYSDSVSITDKDGNEIARVVYSPNTPLSCGAYVWIEADSNNVQINKTGESHVQQKH